MKQYVVDELRPEDHEKIETYLEENFGPAQLGEVYWIPLEETALSDTQSEHSECQPFYFTIVLESTKLAGEFLVRTREKIRCECVQYASESQRNLIIGFIDSIFEKLGVMA